MSWLYHLIHSGARLLEKNLKQGGYIQGHSYDFVRHMQMLAEAMGLTLETIQSNMASLRIPVRGSNYLVLMDLGGDRIRISATSEASFPPHGMPGEVIQSLPELNRSLPRCALEAVHLSNGSLVVVSCQTEARLLDPEAFDAALRDLLNAIVAFDDLLRANDYGRYFC